MKPMKLVSIFVFLALLLAACDQAQQVLGIQAQPSATPPVPVVQAASGVIAEGNVAPRDSAWLFSRSGGEVAQINVKVGDQVDKDAVLLVFGDHEGKAAALSTAKLEQTSALLDQASAQQEQIAAQQAIDTLNKKAGVAASAAQVALTQATKALIDAQQKLANLDTTQYQDDLDSLQKDVGTTKSDLDDAQKEFDKVKDMDPSNQQRKDAEDKLKDAQKKYDDAVRKRDTKINDLDQAKAAVDAAQAQKDDAQHTYDDRKAGPDPDDMALAQAALATAQAHLANTQSRVANAEEQVKAAQTALDDLTIRAPFAGTITSLNPSVGETVMPNQPILQIADLSDLYVETNDLTEMEVVRIKQGQTAKGVPDSMKDLTIPLIVDRIDQVSGKKGGDVTYTVRLKIDRPDPRLRWGMTVEVTFDQ